MTGSVEPEPPIRRIWTVGHSARTADELVALLAGAGITAVADVRRHPGSRRHPQFERGALARHLASHGLRYEWLPALGGRRSARPDSPNTAWRNASFRGYADHMATEEFRGGIERLLALAATERVAVMCSEGVWWRCHRSLIADELKARGHHVEHILPDGRREEHPYTPAARIVDGRLTYAAAGETGDLFAPRD